MSTAAVSVPSTRAQAKRSSLRRSRRWALVASYVFLIMFAIFFLIPPYYMVVTAFKTDAEVARIGSMNSDVAAPSGRSPERMPSMKE
jgi:multiple sugar transport system permease protein